MSAFDRAPRRCKGNGCVVMLPYSYRTRCLVCSAPFVASSQASRARMYGRTGSFTAQEWLDLCAEFAHMCVACYSVAPLVADHIVPLSMGGDSIIENIQPVCVTCNGRKLKVADHRQKAHAFLQEWTKEVTRFRLDQEELLADITGLQAQSHTGKAQHMIREHVRKNVSWSVYDTIRAARLHELLCSVEPGAYAREIEWRKERGLLADEAIII